MWDIGKIIKCGHYLYCIIKEHPNSTKNGYVLHHRAVMENYIGRLLLKNEINGDKKDNRIENLKIMESKEHGRLHGLEKGSLICVLKCPWCGIIFERPKNKTQLVIKEKRYSCCSRKCSGSFSRQMQLYGETNNDTLLIKENVVKIYRKYLTTEEK